MEKNKTPSGQILLNNITKLETTPVGNARHPLHVHFVGKPEQGAGSPWVLDFNSNVSYYDIVHVVLTVLST